MGGCIFLTTNLYFFGRISNSKSLQSCAGPCAPSKVGSRCSSETFKRRIWNSAFNFQLRLAPSHPHRKTHLPDLFHKLPSRSPLPGSAKGMDQGTQEILIQACWANLSIQCPAMRSKYWGHQGSQILKPLSPTQYVAPFQGSRFHCTRFDGFVRCFWLRNLGKEQEGQGTGSNHRH